VTGVQTCALPIYWAAHAPGLKTVEHALDIRRRIFNAFELV
jgi:NADH dehydrogenase FAD-containing subunit